MENRKLEPGKTLIGKYRGKDEYGKIHNFQVYYGNVLFPQINGKFGHIPDEDEYLQILEDFLNQPENEDYIIPTPIEIDEAAVYMLNLEEEYRKNNQRGKKADRKQSADTAQEVPARKKKKQPAMTEEELERLAMPLQLEEPVKEEPAAEQVPEETIDLDDIEDISLPDTADVNKAQDPAPEPRPASDAETDTPDVKKEDGGILATGEKDHSDDAQIALTVSLPSEEEKAEEIAAEIPEPSEPVIQEEPAPVQKEADTAAPAVAEVPVEEQPVIAEEPVEASPEPESVLPAPEKETEPVKKEADNTQENTKQTSEPKDEAKAAKQFSLDFRVDEPVKEIIKEKLVLADDQMIVSKDELQALIANAISSFTPDVKREEVPQHADQVSEEPPATYAALTDKIVDLTRTVTDLESDSKKARLKSIIAIVLLVFSLMANIYFFYRYFEDPHPNGYTQINVNGTSYKVPIADVVVKEGQKKIIIYGFTTTNENGEITNVAIPLGEFDLQP